MKTVKKILSVVMLATVIAAQAQSGETSQSTANPKPSKTAKAKPKTQEQILLEQLNEKFEAIDQLKQDYGDLRRRFDALQKQMDARDIELEAARKAAADAQRAATEAKQKTDSTQAAVGPEGSAVTQLKSDVAALKETSTSLAAKVETTQQETKKLENSDVLHFKGIDLIPGGFVAGETVNRQRATGGDVNTQFSGIPFPGQTAGQLSEFNASGRQSRISLMAVSKLPAATLRAYYEADFLSAGTTSNDNQSNSYTLRQRQAWGQAEMNRGWALTFGQMWSLATEYKSGLTNTDEAIPLTIDSQYNVGFTWERQYGFRVAKRIGDKLWFGGALEEAQTLNIGGHNLPTISYQQAGNTGGLYNPTANYSYNYAPDLIAKLAYQPTWGHFEVFGVGRFFRDRVYPNGQTPTGAPPNPTPSALGAYTAKTAGGGVGANGRVSLFAKRVDFGVHALAGNGIGRYSSSTLPDATAHPDGSLELLSGGSALGSLEWHTTKRLDLYAYYGGEYVKRAFYNTGYIDQVSQQPILGGYGAPTNNVSGCYTEVLPTSSPNGGGNIPSAATNCNADTRNIQEGTLGWWFRFYRGTHGTFQQGFQYSYVVRHTWQGNPVNPGDPANGLPGSPKAIDNMFFTSFRYYLPQ